MIDKEFTEIINKCLIITGLTATGKTKLAYQLAKNFNGILINADSTQVYKYMNIGTGKEKFPDIETKLLDLVTPDQNYTVSDFQKDALFQIKSIISSGKLPIIVGGSPLYINALIYNYKFTPQEQNKLRNVYSNLSVNELREKIIHQDNKILSQINNSDLNNPRRLVRILEKTTNKINIHSNDYRNIKINNLYALNFNLDNLNERIEKRVSDMFKKGLLEEQKGLLEKGYNYDLKSMHAIGYQEFKNYFQDQITLEQVRNEIIVNTYKYAKKQFTWFKKDENIKWINGIDEVIK